MAKRDFGSVRQLPSGRWQARYRDPDGKRRTAPQTFTTKREANRWLTLKAAEIERGEWINPDAGKITLGEWGTRWLESVRPSLKPKTYASYLSLFKTQVKPRFGESALTSIRPMAVSEWIADMSGRGLSASRIRQAHVVLALMMETAVNNELIRVSPCVGTKLPRVVVRDPVILTQDQVAALVKAAVPPHDLLIEIMAYTGLRIGEAFALRRRSIDLEAACIRVTETLVEISGKTSFGTPKDHQVRDVEIPAFLVRRLRAHLDEMEDQSPNALLFVNRRGNPLHYNAWRTWKFDPAADKAGLDSVKPHDLRASHASWVADRWGVLAAGRRLGHSNTTITTRHYARRLEGRDTDVARGLEALRDGDKAPRARTGHDEDDDDPPGVPVPA
ncbi:Site-specific recombinase XerD [Thermomonospora echinospora]|uniref:Site-specific recombinase XerD n=1 Tax=Thermomonospora echinospora TaxID=1992 RepID=A0A1H5Z7V4_9ACTN|nr:tyrosine-type recombinase/integrase [Thermomonospora echinospora]SEG31426.1 Site-specific recombinase XerD [Thermomonospora echinospora]